MDKEKMLKYIHELSVDCEEEGTLDEKQTVRGVLTTLYKVIEKG